MPNAPDNDLARLTQPGGNYLPAVSSTGPLLHLAGQVARRGETMLAVGLVGKDVDLELAKSNGSACTCHHQHSAACANGFIIQIDANDRICTHHAGAVGHFFKRCLARF